MTRENFDQLKPGNIVMYNGPAAHFLGKITRIDCGIIFQPIRIMHLAGQGTPPHIDWERKQWVRNASMTLVNQETKLENYRILAKNGNYISSTITKRG